MVTRPTTVPRHTYANLKSSGCYTLNHVPVALAAQAHYTS
ncbi:MAG: flavin oxidoreductase, partial [Hymenobacter sp.]|nr:flavin oxidoreductase [Hymenobacter sp.]